MRNKRYTVEILCPHGRDDKVISVPGDWKPYQVAIAMRNRMIETYVSPAAFLILAVKRYTKTERVYEQINRFHVANGSLVSDYHHPLRSV